MLAVLIVHDLFNLSVPVQKDVFQTLNQIFILRGLNLVAQVLLRDVELGEPLD